MIVRLNDIIEKIENKILYPEIERYEVGIPGFDQLYSVILGRTTYIGGSASSGKTEWDMEMKIRLSEKYGFKHFMVSPETGTAEDIYLELICKYEKRLLRQTAFERITVDIARNAYAFIHSHFFVREIEENSPSVIELLEECKEFLKEERFHTVTIDPWNELAHDFSPYGGREDKYLEFILGKFRRFCKKQNLHGYIVVHPRTLQKNKEGKYDPPTAYEFSGGGVWYAKADSILCVYRPFEFSESSDSTFTDIIIQKAKPKSVGKKGVFECDYDIYKGRYKSRPAKPEWNS